jgi:glycerate 2-kinase
MTSPRQTLQSLFQAALDAADPLKLVARHLPKPPKGRTVVIGAGKAAAAMAKAVETRWPGPLSGLVVTRYGHGLPLERIEAVEAGHPMPDRAGEEAATRILAMVSNLTANDLVLALISGGGSALLALPAPCVAFEEKRRLNKALLASGASIGDINTVRRHLSAIKGGRLAAAAFPAPVVTLAISDVPGDDPATIASGPTVADPTTIEDARAVLARYGLATDSPLTETPKPGDPRLASNVFRLIARPADALTAAAFEARRQGFEPLMLGSDIEGEARLVAADHAQLALNTKPGTAILSGGETTVTVRGNGRGGRNAEYLLALEIALDGAANIAAIACDTDGIDGTEDNAGAFLLPGSLARAKELGLNPQTFLTNNDAYGFFQALGDLLITGPTRTNVNDFRALLVLPG